MERQYLIEPENFEGAIASTVYNGSVELSGYTHNAGGDDLTVEEYLIVDERSLQLVTGAEVDAMMNAYYQKKYLSKPAEQITATQFFDALEVLPPENWVRGWLEHFRMCEYLTGTITAQYARLGKLYLRKNINVTDKSTWIGIADFDGLAAIPDNEINE